MSKKFRNDDEIFKFVEEQLYTAVVSDVMDDEGIVNQVMSENLRPLTDTTRLVGRARTQLWVDNFEIVENNYENEIKAVDLLKKGDVSVHYCGYSGRIAPWGDLMSTASKMRGAHGAIIDGLVRDVNQIRKMNFPVFCTGIRPLDSKGRGVVVDYDVPIQCGGVLVRSGDLVIGDYDGVVVIPKEVEQLVLEKAHEKVTKENFTRQELLDGKMLLDVYRKYGVL